MHPVTRQFALKNVPKIQTVLEPSLARKVLMEKAHVRRSAVIKLIAPTVKNALSPIVKHCVPRNAKKILTAQVTRHVKKICLVSRSARK